MSKAMKKSTPAKGQSSLFSFFKKKSAPEVTELPQSQSQSQSQSQPQSQSTAAAVVTQSPPKPQPQPKLSNNENKDKQSFVVMEDDKSLYVGRQVRVYWPNEKQWYMGKVSSYDKDENTHSIVYEDGDVEDLCLDREKVCEYECMYACTRLSLTDRVTKCFDTV
jgi:hypothetical protein